MKRVSMLLAVASMVVAAMALSGVAQADSPSEMCRERAEELTGKTLKGYTFVVGTADSNTFSPIDGRAEVFCGFDGDDHIDTLRMEDIFIGGAGNDSVDRIDFRGTFNGGTGNDYVFNYYGGDLVNVP